MFFKYFIKITAAVIITITAISFSSCSEEDSIAKPKQQELSLGELELYLRNQTEKSVVMKDNFTEKTTGVTGNLYVTSYSDTPTDSLLITNSEPEMTDKAGIVRRTMVVWIDEDTGQGYWSCSGAPRGNCVRIGGTNGITISW